MTSIDTDPYELGLDKNAANYVPLTPIGFLLRSAAVYPGRLAVAQASDLLMAADARTLPSTGERAGGLWRRAR